MLGNGYTEGNAWHHSFPPYALTALTALHGGKAKLLQQLHHMLTMPSGFQAGSYGREIHEMTGAPEHTHTCDCTCMCDCTCTCAWQLTSQVKSSRPMCADMCTDMCADMCAVCMVHVTPI